MNIVEAMKRVDRSDSNKAYINYGDLVDVFSMSELFGFYTSDTSLKAYWLMKLTDTDEYVGTRVYEFEGELVAYSEKSSRNSDEVFYWVSENDYNVVRNYLFALLAEEQGSTVPLLNINTEIDETFTAGHNGIVEDEREAIYQGDYVRIVNFIYDGWDSRRVVIALANGTEIEVLVTDLKFPIRVV